MSEEAVDIRSQGSDERLTYGATKITFDSCLALHLNFTASDALRGGSVSWTFLSVCCCLARGGGAVMSRTRGYEKRSERWTKCCDPLLRHPSKTIKKGCRPIITKWIVQNADLDLDRDKYIRVHAVSAGAVKKKKADSRTSDTTAAPTRT